MMASAPRAFCLHCSSATAPIRAPVPLHPTRMSACLTASGNSVGASAVPPLAATNASARPDREKTEKFRHCWSSSSPIRRPAYDPVPRTTTAALRQARAGNPGLFVASSSATDAMDRPAELRVVRVPISFAARAAAWKSRVSCPLAVLAFCASDRARRTWPVISRSPTTADSRPQATAMRCSVTACPDLYSNQAERCERGTPEHLVRESRIPGHRGPASAPGTTSQKTSNRLHVDRTTAPTIPVLVSRIFRGNSRDAAWSRPR